jgi:hypothetical protein
MLNDILANYAGPEELQPDNLLAVCPDCHTWIEMRVREYAERR